MSGPPPSQPPPQFRPGMPPPGALPPGVRPGGPPPPGAMGGPPPMGPNGQPMMRPPGPPRPPGVGPPPGAGPPPPGALGPNGQPLMRGPPPGALPPGQQLPPGVRPPGVGPPPSGPPPGAYPPGQGPPPGAARPPGVGPPPSSLPPGVAPGPRLPQQMPAGGATVSAGAAPSAAAAPAAARPSAAAAAASAQQSAAFAAAAKQREKQASDANIKDLWSALIDEKAAESFRAAAAVPSADDAAQSGASREATIVYVGPRSSGKTTLINAYMYKDRVDDVPKATTCLDYKYTRSSVKDTSALAAAGSSSSSSGANEEKSVSHFWELGGGRSLVDLADVPITAQSIADCLVVLTLDLSTPRITRIVDDATFWLNLVRKRCDAVFAEMKSKGGGGPAAVAALQAAARRRFGDSHADLSRVDLLPVPVLIAVHKFDAVKSLEPEHLRILSRTLRAVAHSYGASLLYTSRQHKDTLLKLYRTRITSFVMSSSGAVRPTQPNFDHTQWIAVNAGQDSFANIGEPPGAAGSAKTPLAAWAQVFPKYFAADAAGQAALAAEDKEDGAGEALALDSEKAVDAAAAARQEDLRRMARELDLRRKLNKNETDGTAGMAASSSVRVR